VVYFSLAQCMYTLVLCDNVVAVVVLLLLFAYYILSVQDRLCHSCVDLSFSQSSTHGKLLIVCWINDDLKRSF